MLSLILAYNNEDIGFLIILERPLKIFNEFELFYI